MRTRRARGHLSSDARTWAPSVSAHYYYFADYEILVGGRYVVWGQSTLDYVPAAAFDPAEVLERIRREAADAHGVDCSEVRVRSVSRL